MLSFCYLFLTRGAGCNNCIQLVCCGQGGPGETEESEGRSGESWGGGETNHSGRLNGKPKKCLFLPKKILSTKQWETLASAILKEGRILIAFV